MVLFIGFRPYAAHDGAREKMGETLLAHRIELDNTNSLTAHLADPHAA
jgi:hypothetical protein